MGAHLWRRRSQSFYVDATFLASQFQHECIPAVTASRSLWTMCILCHCTIHKVYRGFLSMQACAAGYVIMELQFISWTVVGLTAAKFKPPILPMSASSCSIPHTFGFKWFRITSICVLHNLAGRSVKLLPAQSFGNNNSSIIVCLFVA
jgi:hypothetical protein